MEIVLVDYQNFDAAVAIYTDSWRESHKEICTKEFLENRDYKGYLQKKLGKLFLIIDDIPVGVFSMNEDVLGDLYIHPAYQGKGYGTAAIRFAIGKVPQLRLTVLSGNQRAVFLYEKMGFRFTGQDVPLRNGLLEREMRYME